MALRLPKGASWSPKAALAIANNPVRLKAAATYWRQVFAVLGTTDFANLTHPALLLGEQLSDELFSKLMPDRERLVAGCPDTYLIKRSGCLTSLAEIARTVYPAFTQTELLACISALLAVDTLGTTVPPEIAALGIIAAREVFDAIRRYQICKWNGDEFNLPMSELLALYRQEGALCIAPARDSYPHGPVIHTGIGCRARTVTLFDETCERPGFNTVYSFLTRTDAIRNDTSVRFDLLFRNLPALAGVDTVLFPRLSLRDELFQLWKMASSVSSPSVFATLIQKTFREKMAGTYTCSFNVACGKTQRQFFDEMCLGLFRTFLEVGNQFSSVEDLLNDVWLALNSMLSAHAFEPSKPWAGSDVRLSADIDGTDTFECLRTQVRWFASRRILGTLLAWKNRTSVTLGNTLSPFMTYLRFHTGDAIFVGILLRMIVRYDYLLRSWQTNRKSWGTSFLDANPPSGWNAGAVSNLGRDLRNLWASNRVRPETAWHHIGLIESLRNRPNSPSWMGKEQPTDPRLNECAQVVDRLIEALNLPGVLNAVSIALEYTPALWLANHGFTTTTGIAGTGVLVKSHSFERLHLTYKQAAHDVGIE